MTKRSNQSYFHSESPRCWKWDMEAVGEWTSEGSPKQKGVGADGNRARYQGGIYDGI